MQFKKFILITNVFFFYFLPNQTKPNTILLLINNIDKEHNTTKIQKKKHRFIQNEQKHKFKSNQIKIYFFSSS